MDCESFEKKTYSNLPAIVVLTIGVLVILAIAILFIDRLRADTRREQSMQKLVQLALSSLQYETDHSCLPSAALPIALGGPVQGWEYRVLPYLENNHFDWDKFWTRPWDHPDSESTLQLPMTPFHSPHSQELFDDEGHSLNHYAATLETIPFGDPKRLEEFGETKQKMFGEISAGFQSWGKPGNTRTIGNGVWFDEDSFGNPEYNGVSFSYTDGSVGYELFEHERRK